MVPDELANAIAARTVLPGSRVLDPFCGSGRLLMAAAASGADCLGLDINPLACLITDAKAAPACQEVIKSIAKEAAVAARNAPRADALRLQGTKLAWFSERVGQELSEIVCWLNSLQLPLPELVVSATALSAATRDTSWIRKSGWKLHRMSEEDRLRHSRSAWRSFEGRMRHYVSASSCSPLAGHVGTKLSSLSKVADQHISKFDAVLTSPPYGDSRTTVQYGAASAICLDVISRLQGLEGRYCSGRDIDAACLGGHRGPSRLDTLRPYWAGAADSEGAGRVGSFLSDFATMCGQISKVVRPGGTVVMVVGRRSVRGFRVKLDKFAIDEMEALNFSTKSVERRPLTRKSLPVAVNRFARSACPTTRGNGRINTMSEEIIVTFEANVSQPTSCHG